MGVGVFSYVSELCGVFFRFLYLLRCWSFFLYHFRLSKSAGINKNDQMSNKFLEPSNIKFKLFCGILKILRFLRKCALRLPKIEGLGAQPIWAMLVLRLILNKKGSP